MNYFALIVLFVSIFSFILAFIAYNRDYGEAPYIVTDLKHLLRDKSSLISSGDAIRHRRDYRGDWVSRLRGFF